MVSPKSDSIGQASPLTQPPSAVSDVPVTPIQQPAAKAEILQLRVLTGHKGNTSNRQAGRSEQPIGTEQDIPIPWQKARTMD